MLGLNIDVLSDHYDGFWQALHDKVQLIANETSQREISITQVKENKDLQSLMGHTQPGDILQWYEWDDGPCRYAAGFAIARNNQLIAKHNVIVS